MTNDNLAQLAINTIRTLSIDAVQAAKSGHPDTPMALAPHGNLRLAADNSRPSGAFGVTLPGSGYSLSTVLPGEVITTSTRRRGVGLF